MVEGGIGDAVGKFGFGSGEVCGSVFLDGMWVLGGIVSFSFFFVGESFFCVLLCFWFFVVRDTDFFCLCIV